jgi:uncharacterized protein
MKHLLLIYLILILPASCFADITVPPLTARVNDYANIIPDAVQLRLENQLKQHEDSTSNQIVVLTVTTLGNESIEEAADLIFNTWKLGQLGKDNGVLLLIAVEDRRLRIEVGHGLEGTLTDAHCSRIIRNEITPLFRTRDFSEGITAGVTAIRGAIYGTYSSEDPGFWEGLLQYEGMGFPEVILPGIFVMGILLLFTLLAFAGEGLFSYFLFLFLIPFYLTFPFAVFGSFTGFVILAAYAGTFGWSRIWFQKAAGKAWLKKRGYSGKGGGSYSSSGRSSGSSRRSFSGGGGRSGGGGSSGSW